MLNRIASLTLEIQTTTTKPILYFDLISMSALTWITEKELERDKKQRRPISLKEKHKNFKKGGNASCHRGENERQRKKSQQEHIKHVTRKFLVVVVQNSGKEMYKKKKVCCMCKVVFFAN